MAIPFTHAMTTAFSYQVVTLNVKWTLSRMCLLQSYHFKHWFGYCALQTSTTKENTKVQKLQVIASALKYKPPSPTQMQNWYLHLQSLVRSKSRVYNQFPFNNSSELGIFFKNGFHIQHCPCKPDLKWHQVKAREMSSSLRKNTSWYSRLTSFLS